MRKIYGSVFAAALLSGGLLLAGARQDTSSRLAGTVTDTAGVGLPATTVWVAANPLSQAEITQIAAAQKEVESAKVRLTAEQAKFEMGASVMRFVLKEQQDVLQAEARRTVLEATAIDNVLPAFRTQRTLVTDGAGGFEVRGLAPGSYVIKAFRRGFEPSFLTVVEVRSGQDARADLRIRPF
jgi:hypothetical protein